MEKTELLSFIERMAEKVNEIAVNQRTSANMGFAIRIPDGVDEEALREVDQKLIKLGWTFERTKIRRREYCVLFPMG